MTKQLNVYERITLLNLLPKETDLATLKIIRDLQSSLGLNEQEFEEFGIKQSADGLSWNNKGKEDKEIEFGKKAETIIVEALKKLDKEKKVTANLLSLFDKFEVGE